MNIFNVVFVLFMGICSISGQKSCNLKEIDLCISNFIFGQSSVPANEYQLQKACQASRELRACAYAYFNRCLSKLQIEMINWMGGALNKEFSDRCEAPAGSEAREMVFRYAPCLNSASKERRKCYDFFRLPLEYSFTQRYDKRVPIGCCAALKTFECSYSVVEKKCGKKSADFFATYFPLETYIQTICEGYEVGGDKCKENQPPIGWSPDKNSKSAIIRLMDAYLGV